MAQILGLQAFRPFSVPLVYTYGSTIDKSIVVGKIIGWVTGCIGHYLHLKLQLIRVYIRFHSF